MSPGQFLVPGQTYEARSHIHWDGGGEKGGSVLPSYVRLERMNRKLRSHYGLFLH